MVSDLSRAIEQIVKDKGISREVLIEASEKSIEAAARKMLGPNTDIEARYNEELGEVELFEFKTVVEELEDEEVEISLEEAQELVPGVEPGESLGIKLNLDGFGRIAAQTAKQVLLQHVRDAEREHIYNEYRDKKDGLITGTVRRFEKGALIVDLGKAEAVLPSREQVASESYRPGDRIQCYVLDVLNTSRGSQIILSRTHPGLVRRLFEMEVPEIFDGVVRIENVAREAGFRTKIAVASRDSDVDPVGACVGMKGSRVQAVVQELRNERIDIIPWSIDPAKYVCNAIAPALVTKVIIDEENESMELIVPDDQLSAAIGRRGQNVRLASQLTGWRIDIISETRIAEMNALATAELMSIDGLSETLVDVLVRHGYRAIGDVAGADRDELVEFLGIEPERAERIIAGARLRQEELADKAERDAEAATAALSAGEPRSREDSAGVSAQAETRREAVDESSTGDAARMADHASPNKARENDEHRVKVHDLSPESSSGDEKGADDASRHEESAPSSPSGDADHMRGEESASEQEIGAT